MKQFLFLLISTKVLHLQIMLVIDHYLLTWCRGLPKPPVLGPVAGPNPVPICLPAGCRLECNFISRSNSIASNLWFSSSFCCTANFKSWFNVFFSSSAAVSWRCSSSTWELYSSHRAANIAVRKISSHRHFNLFTRDLLGMRRTRNSKLLSLTTFYSPRMFNSCYCISSSELLILICGLFLDL